VLAVITIQKAINPFTRSTAAVLCQLWILITQEHDRMRSSHLVAKNIAARDTAANILNLLIIHYLEPIFHSSPN